MDTGKRTEQKAAMPPAAFPFESRYIEMAGRRVHYVEEGRGAPVLFVHGNPTSSYIWRNILPQVAAGTGRRGIALDLLGFGRSDKLENGEYTLDLHAEVLSGFIEKLGLKDLVLVLHDWGGPLGMWYAARHPENVQGVVLMETFLWDMAWKDFGKFAPVFRLMRSPAGYILIQVMNIFVNRVLPGSVVNKDHMTREVMAWYRKPFPTAASRRAIRVFPQLIPIEGMPESSRKFIDAINASLPRLTCPVLWVKATPGAIVTDHTEFRLTALAARIPRLEIKEFGPGLHYLQEDDPRKLADMIAGWIRGHHLHDLPAEVDRILSEAA
jgi:haloalkane dehalogenase